MDVLRRRAILETPEVFWLLILGTGAQCLLKESLRVKILKEIEPMAVAESLSRIFSSVLRAMKGLVSL